MTMAAVYGKIGHEHSSQSPVLGNVAHEADPPPRGSWTGPIDIKGSKNGRAGKPGFSPVPEPVHNGQGERVWHSAVAMVEDVHV